MSRRLPRRRGAPRRIAAPAALGSEPLQRLCRRQQPYGQSALAPIRNATQTVIGELKARGLLFLDYARTSASALSAAERQGVPTVTRDVLLDDDVTAGSVNDGWRIWRSVARQRGTAIAIGHPHDQTLDALSVVARRACRRKASNSCRSPPS